MIFVQAALQIILGIAGGLAVGSGVIAFFYCAGYHAAISTTHPDV